MQTKYFGTFALANLKGFTMVDDSKNVAYMRSHEVFQKLVTTIQNMKCIPLLINDVVYLICTYLQKN
jgi:cytochrome b involved in lipid metabolism